MVGDLSIGGSEVPEAQSENSKAPKIAAAAATVRLIWPDTQCRAGPILSAKSAAKDKVSSMTYYRNTAQQ